MDKSQKQILVAQIKEKFRSIKPHLSENGLRIWAASESISIGRGGDTIVKDATGLSRVTITKGKKELAGKKNHPPGKGRKSLLKKYPKLLRDIDNLIYPFERKEPVPTLCWTQDSTYEILRKLKKKDYKISQKSVYSIMQADGYIMHTNQKRTLEILDPHFGMQFDYVYEKLKKFHKLEFPAISLDMLKYVGSKNKLTLHDLMNTEAWKYTVLDTELIKFAGESIQKWWLESGQFLYL